MIECYIKFELIMSLLEKKTVESLLQCESLVSLLIKDKNFPLNYTNISGKSLLYICCENNWFVTVELLFSFEDIDISIEDKKGITPFTVACYNDSKEVIEIFLKYGYVSYDEIYESINIVNDRNFKELKIIFHKHIYNEIWFLRKYYSIYLDSDLWKNIVCFI